MLKHFSNRTFLELIRFPAAFDHLTESYVMSLHVPLLSKIPVKHWKMRFLLILKLQSKIEVTLNHQN